MASGKTKNKKTFTYNPKTTLQHTPKYEPSSLLSWQHHTGHVLDIQLYTSPIALTRGLYLLLKWWHYIRDERKKCLGAYKLAVEHCTVIWLVWGMKQTKRLFVCAGGGHMQRCLIACETSRRQSGDLVLKSRLGRDTTPPHLWYHKLSFHTWVSRSSSLSFFSEQVTDVVVSQSRVKVCVVLLLSVCQVLRALSILCCCRLCGSVLYAWVSASRCAWCYVYQCVWNFIYGAALCTWDRL